VGPDVRILFCTRALRLFAFGFFSVILALFLAALGLSERRIGLLLTLALAGDAVVSLILTTRADRMGRKRVLIASALLMVLAGVVFATGANPWLLMLAAVVGILSPSGHEVGAFLSVEQASLAQLVTPARRTRTFARYILAGSLSTAVGALAGGAVAHALQARGFTELSSYRVLAAAYAACGIALLFLFQRLSRGIEAPVSTVRRNRFGLHRSRKPVAALSALFALDSFAGGFIVQSILAYWFHVRFQLDIAQLGMLFFAANVIAGFSALVAARIAERVGLINTMVLTHLPSNVMLCLVPLMPNATLAIAVLLARYTISQMDVPTRQSYTMAVVDPDERAAAAGITGLARSAGAAFSPAISGWMLGQAALASIPFFVAGGLKIVYDLWVFVAFRKLKPPEEKP